MNDRTLSQAASKRGRLWLRPSATTFGVLLSLMSVGACGDDEPALSYLAVAGEDCHDCRDCSGVVNSCICKTCTELAYDPNRKELLVCTGIWEVQKECPGGVSVVCAGTGYDIKCLDENGQPK